MARSSCCPANTALTVALLSLSLLSAGCDKEPKESSANKPDTETAKQKAKAEAVDNNETSSHKNGMVVRSTEQDFLEVRDTIEGALSANSSHTILARIDYPPQRITHFGDAPEDKEGSNDTSSGAGSQAKQGDADASKAPPPPGAVFLISEPNLEIPLVKESQLTGLDLPQTLAVWENEDGDTSVAFNVPAYLTARHSIEAAELILMKLGGGMRKLLSSATGLDFGELPSADDIDLEAGAGIKSVRAYQGTSKTADRLAKSVKKSNEFVFVERVNHTENAKAVDETIRPIQTVFALHPKFGLKMYGASPSVVVDMPFRFAALEDKDGVVQVVYTSPEYLAKRHGIDDTEMIEGAADAMKDVAEEAAQGGDDE